MGFENLSGTFRTLRKIEEHGENLKHELADFDRLMPRALVFESAEKLDTFNAEYAQWETSRDEVRDQLNETQRSINLLIAQVIREIPERNKFFVVVDGNDQKWLIGWRYNEYEKGTRKIKIDDRGWSQLVIAHYDRRKDSAFLAKHIGDRIDY
jgi:hypothetical protein